MTNAYQPMASIYLVQQATSSNSNHPPRWGSVNTVVKTQKFAVAAITSVRVPRSGNRCGLRGLGMGLGWKGDDGTRMDVPDGLNMRKQTGTISINLHQTDTSKDLHELSVYRLSWLPARPPSA